MNTIVQPAGISALDELLAACPSRIIAEGEKYVIISDLHLGNGGKNDDFRRNGALFLDILRSWYLPRGYFLILNGDIEELLRAARSDIVKAWRQIYALFEAFRAEGRLVWLQGNHEVQPDTIGHFGPVASLNPDDPATLKHPFDGEGLRLLWQDKTLFIFHGHQAGRLNSGRYNAFIGWFLRVVANGLRIGNYSVANDSEKKIRIEQAVYGFSRRHGIASIIGHTHRPLFESLSKHEYLGFQIERLCREYAQRRGSRRRGEIRQTILHYRDEYIANSHKSERHLADNVYGEILIPCLFNAGCGIGKRGITTMEIKDERMYLIFWSDRARSERAMDYNEYRSAEDVGGDSFRFILRRENLDYIFSRIELLR